MNSKNYRDELKAEGYAVIKYDKSRALHSYPYDTPWLEDKEFSALYEKISNNTLVDRTRCYSHYLLVKQVLKLKGDILEVGVYKGGTAALIASCAPKKHVYLADTFEGVVKSNDWEHYNDGAHADTSIKIVEELMDKLSCKNYTILEGIFPEETGDMVNGVGFCYVHIDVDVYQSAKDVLEKVWSDVVVGGLVVFDDYGFISACGGIYKLVEELRNDSDKMIITNLNGHAYIIKR